jgi:hypothetical protein
LLHIPHDYLGADRLLRAALKLKITNSELAHIRKLADDAWTENGAPERGTLSITASSSRKQPKKGTVKGKGKEKLEST